MAPISTRSVFGSRSKSIRSLAVNLPASCSFSMRFFHPPRYIFSSSCYKFLTRRRMRSSLKLNSNSLFEIAIGVFLTKIRIGNQSSNSLPLPHVEYNKRLGQHKGLFDNFCITINWVCCSCLLDECFCGPI